MLSVLCIDVENCICQQPFMLMSTPFIPTPVFLRITNDYYQIQLLTIACIFHTQIFAHEFGKKYTLFINHASL